MKGCAMWRDAIKYWFSNTENYRKKQPAKNRRLITLYIVLVFPFCALYRFLYTISSAIEGFADCIWDLIWTRAPEWKIFNGPYKKSKRAAKEDGNA
jgi:hypothetical protein